VVTKRLNVRTALSWTAVRETGESGDDVFDDFAVDVGQPHIPTPETKRLAGVVDAKQMKHRRVQIVHLAAVFDRTISKFVGCSVRETSANAAARHPDAKAEWIVIASVRALRKGRAAEFPGPNNERSRQQPSRLKILEQARDWPIHRTRIVFVTRL